MYQLSAARTLEMIAVALVTAALVKIFIAGGAGIVGDILSHHAVAHQLVQVAVDSSRSHRLAVPAEVLAYIINIDVFSRGRHHIIKYIAALFSLVSHFIPPYRAENILLNKYTTYRAVCQMLLLPN
jgi:hypothetical protein